MRNRLDEVAVIIALVILPWTVAFSWISRSAYFKESSGGFGWRARWLHQRGFHRLALKLLLLKMLMPYTSINGCQCGARLAVTGPARIGKSLVTKRVAAELACPIVSLDQLLPLVNTVGGKHRQDDALWVVQKILEVPVQSVVFEGDLLLGEAWPIQKDGAPRGGGYSELDERILTEMKVRCVKIVALGCADANVDEKATAIHCYAEVADCWTRNHDGLDLTTFSERIVRRSREIKRMATKLGIPYVEMPVRFTDEYLKTVIARVLHAIRSDLV